MDGKDSKLEGTKGSTMFCVKYVSMNERERHKERLEGITREYRDGWGGMPSESQKTAGRWVNKTSL